MAHVYDIIWSKKKPKSVYKSIFNQKEIALFKKFDVHKVLDLGSGDGTNLAILAKRGFDVHGIDISNVGVAVAVKKLTSKRLIPKLKAGDIYKKLPYKRGEFDAVYSYQVIDHSSLPNIRKMLREVHRILKGGGIFSVLVGIDWKSDLMHVTDNIYIEKHPIYVRYKRIKRNTFVPLDGGEAGLVHYLFSKQEFFNEMKKAGFKLINKRKQPYSQIIANFLKT